MKKITAFAQVYNEESRIEEFVRNFQWVDELVIFNKSSTDRTKELALNSGNNVKLIDVDYDDASDGLKDWVTNYKSNEWCLFVTASDLIDPGLADLIKDFIKTDNDYGLIYLPFKVFCLGETSRFSPFNTKYKPLLFKKDSLILSSKLHYEYQTKINTKSHTIKSNKYFVYHLTNNNPEEAFKKAYRYCKVEAKQMSEEFGEKKALRIAFYHFFKAILTGIFKKGILFGGLSTFLLWLFHLNYFITRLILVWDIKKNGSQNKVNVLRKNITSNWEKRMK